MKLNIIQNTPEKRLYSRNELYNHPGKVFRTSWWSADKDDLWIVTKPALNQNNDSNRLVQVIRFDIKENRIGLLNTNNVYWPSYPIFEEVTNCKIIIEV